MDPPHREICIHVLRTPYIRYVPNVGRRSRAHQTSGREAARLSHCPPSTVHCPSPNPCSRSTLPAPAACVFASRTPHSVLSGELARQVATLNPKLASRVSTIPLRGKTTQRGRNAHHLSKRPSRATQPADRPLQDIPPLSPSSPSCPTCVLQLDHLFRYTIPTPIVSP